MRDPNQPYVPEPYPLMLYNTPDHTIVVSDEAEEAAARAAGFTDWSDIDPERDGLELRDHPFLVDRAVTLIRANLARLSREELLDGVRDLEAAEYKRLADLKAEADAKAVDAAVEAAEAERLRQETDAEAARITAAQVAEAEGKVEQGLDGEGEEPQADETQTEEPPPEEAPPADEPGSPDLDAMTDEALFALVVEKTQRAPHPLTGRKKLLALAQAALHPAAPAAE